jgi:hypothetical protein
MRLEAGRPRQVCCGGYEVLGGKYEPLWWKRSAATDDIPLAQLLFDIAVTRLSFPRMEGPALLEDFRYCLKKGQDDFNSIP